ncbi:MAG: DUF5686 family protein, partial [Marinilabiliales bacterium]|nr:DUF5686 family protein [Marinilabiliales bacterium]
NLMESERKKSEPGSGESLELTENVKVKTDPQAVNRDTAYWNQLRPIPLAEEELHSFRKKDSLVMAEAQHPNQITVANKKVNAGWLAPLFVGKRFNYRDSTWHFRYGGLFNFKRIQFNAVDGFVVSQEATWTKTLGPSRQLEIQPKLAYAFGRKQWMGQLALRYPYAPLHRGSLQVMAGSQTQDFNAEPEAISPFINGVASLFFKTNFARFFDAHRYVVIRNAIDLANGWVLKGEYRWKDVKPLENNTQFSFVDSKDDYQPNLPANDQILPENLQERRESVAGIHLEFTPQYFYRIKNGVKIMSHSNYPTFSVGYEKGIDGMFSSTADFDHLMAGITYARVLSQTSSLAFDLNGGTFFNSKSLHFSDFAHAQTQTSPVLPHEYRHAFYVPNYYALSTSNRYLYGFVSYKSPFILLKYLPVLSNTLWREMVWGGFWASPDHPFHLEGGYTLLEVFYSANVGIFAGFDRSQLTRIGLNMSFRISL